MNNLLAVSLFGYDLVDAGAVTILVLFASAVIQYLLRDKRRLIATIEAKDKEIKELNENNTNDLLTVNDQYKETMLGIDETLGDVIEFLNGCNNEQKAWAGNNAQTLERLIELLNTKFQRLEDIIRDNK